jgi:hypothetical protein
LAPLAVWIACIGLAVAAFVIQVTKATGGATTWGYRGGEGVLCLIFATVGAVVSTKRPGHRIGRIFVVMGFLAAVQYFTEEFAAYILTGNHRVPGEAVIFWVQDWVWIFGVILLGLLLLHFPDGELTSRAEERVARLLVLVGTATLTSWAFLPPTIEVASLAVVDNPLGVLDDTGTAEMIAVPLTLVLMGSLVACAVLLALRFKRAVGVRRLQLKWFVYAAALASTMLVASAVEVLGALSGVLGSLAIGLLAVSASVAIFRYRLYDIDILVNRALVYGSLTAFLVGAYLGSVVALQVLLEPFTKDSDLAVAAATLAVAALFRPVRARLQAFIDRRFYRSKYDSATALAEFGQRLRDEVNLDALQRDVTAVLRDTVQPAHAALWINAGGTP